MKELAVCGELTSKDVMNLS